MLKNASSLAIVGLDTAENGPSKVRQVTNRIDAIIGSGAAGGPSDSAGAGVGARGRCASLAVLPRGVGFEAGRLSSSKKCGSI